MIVPVVTGEVIAYTIGDEKTPSMISGPVSSPPGTSPPAFSVIVYPGGAGYGKIPGKGGVGTETGAAAGATLPVNGRDGVGTDPYRVSTPGLGGSAYSFTAGPTDYTDSTWVGAGGAGGSQIKNLKCPWELAAAKGKKGSKSLLSVTYYKNQ